MKCSKCQSDNRKGVNFCEECGAKLDIECPACKTKIPLGKKFCGECGRSLSDTAKAPPKDISLDEKLTKIQKYLPRGLTNKILSQRDKIEGERKQVTVMFCDMKGFTSLSEMLGIEDAYAIMDEVYEILIHKVHEFGGTVNEMTGDGIMALYGVPIAIEDATQRAIRSSLAIHREMAGFSRKLKQKQKDAPPIKMRIGIHSGPVVVGTLGNDLHVEFKAVGDTVNLASRIEGLAEPGTTYVTEDSFRLSEGFFGFEAIGKKHVKGKKNPVNVYRVVAPSGMKTRFDVSAERGLTAFVGRVHELELLLDGYERAKAGRGQAFSIVSEAGIGKSRLLYEFQKAVGGEDISFLLGKCLSYGYGIAYHPITDILKAIFDIKQGDGDAEITKKVKRRLKVFEADEDSALPYLLEFLSVRGSGIDQISMSPEARKDRIIQSLIQIIIKESEIRTLILAIEDLHWIDKSSEECLKVFLERIPGARIILILTYRPEFVHTWGGKSYHSQVNLNRLSNRESLEMVRHLLGTEKIETNLEELILGKTEGVPFFIEELIKSLRDLKVIEKRNNSFDLVKDIQGVVIPSTIQDMIMARVDSLPESAKEVLQAGSVIEREFSYDLIKRVTGLRELELLSHLSVLKDSELLYERGVYPNSTYIFKHMLTREVVYESMLTKRKRILHEKIGNSIEVLYGENIDNNSAILAEHYSISENYDKAARYSKLAYKQAVKKASFNNAIAYARKEIACLERLPQTNDVQKKTIDARTALALYYVQMDFYVEAKETVKPVVEFALKQNYERRISQIYTVLGAYSFEVEEDFPKSFKYLEDALKISKELSDNLSLVMARIFLATALSRNCRFKIALNHYQKVLQVNEAANNLWGLSTIKSLIAVRVLHYQGNIDLGYKTSEEAVRMAEQGGDILSKAMAYTSHGCSWYYKGKLENAKEYLLRGVDLCQKINYFAWTAFANWCLGETFFEEGDYQKSQHFYNKTISLIENSRLSPSFSNLNKVALTRAKVINDEMDIELERLYGYEADNKLKIYEGQISKYISETFLKTDDQNILEAEKWIRKAIEADKRNGLMWNLGRNYALYAEFFKRKGDNTRARENLRKAIEILNECGADRWVSKYKEKMALYS